MTIPKALAEVAKVNKAGDVVFAGTPKKPIKADIYKIAVQAKTPLGDVIEGAAFEMNIELVEKKKPAAE